MSPYYLLPLALLFTTAHAWQINATTVTGIEYMLRSSSGATRECDGLNFGFTALDFFVWIPNQGATAIELYPSNNCVGTKKVGVAGWNDINPNAVYVSYKVLA